MPVVRVVVSLALTIASFTSLVEGKLLMRSVCIYFLDVSKTTGFRFTFSITSCDKVTLI